METLLNTSPLGLETGLPVPAKRGESIAYPGSLATTSRKERHQAGSTVVDARKPDKAGQKQRELAIESLAMKLHHAKATGDQPTILEILDDMDENDMPETLQLLWYFDRRAACWYIYFGVLAGLIRHEAGFSDAEVRELTKAERFKIQSKGENLISETVEHIVATGLSLRKRRS
jgi:hypothetical protein